MKKRMLAWVLLVGFLFLMINLIFFHSYLEISFGIYISVVAIFLILNNKQKKK